MVWPTKHSKTRSTTVKGYSFARINLADEGVPDATTLLKFRRLLETHDLCKGLFTAINAALSARSLLLREGTLVDATLIVTAANVADITQTEKLPHGQETQVHADAG
jgi:IS5 family transposase